MASNLQYETLALIHEKLVEPGYIADCCIEQQEQQTNLTFIWGNYKSEPGLEIFIKLENEPIMMLHIDVLNGFRELTQDEYPNLLTCIYKW